MYRQKKTTSVVAHQRQEENTMNANTEANLLNNMMNNNLVRVK
jgi:hypothetical protein